MGLSTPAKAESCDTWDTGELNVKSLEVEGELIPLEDENTFPSEVDMVVTIVGEGEATSSVVC